MPGEEMVQGALDGGGVQRTHARGSWIPGAECEGEGAGQAVSARGSLDPRSRERR